MAFKNNLEAKWKIQIRLKNLLTCSVGWSVREVVDVHTSNSIRALFKVNSDGRVSPLGDMDAVSLRQRYLLCTWKQESCR